MQMRQVKSKQLYGMRTMISDKHDKVVVCDCEDMEHIIRFTWWGGDDISDRFIYVHYFLQHDRLLKRIVNAVKYVCGFKSRYGHFGEVLINVEDVQELRYLFDEFVEDKR